MDIREVSLYLAGKLPPHYNKTNPGRFKRKTKIAFPDYVDESHLDFIQKQSSQQEDLFFMVLDDIAKDFKEWDGYKQLINLLADLEVPEELLWILPKEQYTWSKFLKKVEEKFWSSYSTNDIGEYFEELCRDLLSHDGFINVKIAWSGGDGWIDITADKEVLIWSGTKKLISFVGQCKYKSTGNVSKEEVQQLLSPIEDDSDNMYQWLLFFTNSKYQPQAKNKLEKIQKGKLNVKAFYLDWDEILDVINRHPDLIKKYS
jgi:hypothetical protein